MTFDPAVLRERHSAVMARIAAAAERAGRRPDAVTLVAVTKTWPAELVAAAYEAGMRHFGENRAEELAEKRPRVESLLGAASSDITWHLIGTLQSRKTRPAAEHADVFHALEREKIARRLSGELAAANRRLPCFVEVNLSGEPTKSGLDCSRWEVDATEREGLRKLVIDTSELPGLTVVGLMTMAPWDVEPAVIRDVFSRTRKLAEWLASELPGRAPLQLSMGMTDDYEIAVEEGATHVRVGRALFGERA